MSRSGLATSDTATRPPTSTATRISSLTFTPELTPDLPVPFGVSDDDLSATSETMEGHVTRILSEETLGTVEGTQYVQQIEVEIASGSMQGQRIVTEHGGTIVTTESSQAKPGMRVIVEHTAGSVGDRYYSSDFVRRPAIWGLTLLFVASAPIVSRWTGVRY